MQKLAVRTSAKAPSTDLAYWLSQPVSARLAAVEQLRQQAFPLSNPANHAKHRLQRVCRVTSLHADFNKLADRAIADKAHQRSTSLHLARKISVDDL